MWCIKCKPAEKTSDAKLISEKISLFNKEIKNKKRKKKKKKRKHEIACGNIQHTYLMHIC